MQKSKKFRPTLQALILAVLTSGGAGYTEFCTKSGTDPILYLNYDTCSEGALFPHPVTVDCLATSESESIIADICTGEATSMSGEGPFQVQYFPTSKVDPPDPSTSCAALKKCGKDGYAHDQWVTNIHDPNIPRATPPWPETSDTNDIIIEDQTKRLFRKMMGLSVDDNAAEPVLRIITLLRKSLEITEKFCGNNRFFPSEFAQDVLSAFIFLLGESDTSKIVDIPLEDFRIIDMALNHCMDQKNPFSISGNQCETKPEIERINTTIRTIYENPLTEFSWMPEKYDVPVDVTWAIMDFVHGMCYGYFQENVNSHHLFEQAVEKLFTTEILYRWDKPSTLGLPDHWDNFFSANVRATIYNLEFCIAAAYDNPPFLHRLERMLVKSANANSTNAAGKRRKRSVMQMPQVRDSKFFCFNSVETRDEVLAQWKAATCPDSSDS